MIKRVLDWARREIFSTTFLKFGIVGASGVVVNYGIAYLGYIAGLSDILSLSIGVETAILNNFTWNDLWTFRHRRTLKPPQNPLLPRLKVVGISRNNGLPLPIRTHHRNTDHDFIHPRDRLRNPDKLLHERPIRMT